MDETIGNKNELSRCLVEKIENDTLFDILNWIKANLYRYPCLSQMEKDVLSIPVSIVKSESVFSTGSGVFNPYKSSLKPKAVKTLICAQNILQSPQTTIDLREMLKRLKV